jgi:hypothetical protein
MRTPQWAVLAALGCLGIALSGCTTSRTMGHYVPNSQFAYPNSTIKVLGPTTASITKEIEQDSPGLTVEDMRKVYADALAKVEGANILINYREDTTITFQMFAKPKIQYRLEGEAARMDVGAHVKRPGAGQ